MAASTNPPGVGLARALTIGSLGLLGVAFLLTQVLPGSRAEPPVSPFAAVCSAIRGVPGPEDLEADSSDPNAPRLLISSQDRRPSPQPQGGIFALGLADDRPRRLPLVGRDGCSFHPHGMSLVATAGGTHLAVINHHDPADGGAGTGCLAQGDGTTSLSSVEIFEVEREALRFVARLADPEVLTNPNDLVALPDGTLWITNPAPSPLGQAWEGLLRENEGSRLVRFTCESEPRVPGCSGRFQASRPFGAYLNGIAERHGGRELFVASTAENAIYPLTPEQALAEPAPLLPPPLLFPGPDNLSWADDRRTRLLVAGHPDLRQFLQHAASPSAVSPTRVGEVPVGFPRTAVARELGSDGRFLSAASVAVRLGDDWFVGQVFEPFVLRCRIPGGGEP